MIMVTVKSDARTEGRKSVCASAALHPLPCIVLMEFCSGCCPATNGQSAIQDCILADYEKSCPSDKPQEMTSVTDFYYHHTDLSSIAIPQKFCCPAKPVRQA